MVMKRVEAGEDVFVEFQENSWIPPPNVQQQVQAGAVLYGVFSTVVPYDGRIDTLKIYDSLSQTDQGAVHILYKMAQLRMMRIL